EMSNFEFKQHTRSQLRKKIKIGKEVSQLSFVKLKNMERERGLWKCLLVERTCSLADTLLESLEEEELFGVFTTSSEDDTDDNVDYDDDEYTDSEHEQVEIIFGVSSDSISRKHGREDDDLTMLSSSDADSVVLNNDSLGSSNDFLRKHGETMLLNEDLKMYLITILQ
ncbi:13523_t:CDS:2, partial [Cetraspora pellucida]